MQSCSALSSRRKCEASQCQAGKSTVFDEAPHEVKKLMKLHTEVIKVIKVIKYDEVMSCPQAAQMVFGNVDCLKKEVRGCGVIKDGSFKTEIAPHVSV